MPKTNNGKYQNESQDRRITALENNFQSICENYNHEIGKVQVDIAEIKTNQKILLWFMFAMLAGMIGLFFK